MYAGVIVLFLCIPLVLGSWLALLPGAANAVLMVIRARQEDRMLRAELGGYEVYAHRVRYRLLPGVWRVGCVELSLDVSCYVHA